MIDHEISRSQELQEFVFDRRPADGSVRSREKSLLVAERKEPGIAMAQKWFGDLPKNFPKFCRYCDLVF
jgi:hypothetical protein